MLLRLAAHYPESGHNGKTLAIISDDYLHDLRSEGITPQNFREAVAEARKRTAFFPKVSDIIKAHHSLTSQPQPTRRVAGLLDEHTRERSPEETAIARRNLGLIRRQAEGEITEAEATRLMQEPLEAA